MTWKLKYKKQIEEHNGHHQQHIQNLKEQQTIHAKTHTTPNPNLE